MKKKGIILVVIGILVVILLMIGLYFYGLTSVSNKSEKVTFKVESGTSTKFVINNLYEAKLLKSKISSIIYVKLNNDIMIQAGTYELDRKYDTKEIFEILSGGRVINGTVTVTFIEGKRLTDYVKTISDKFGYSEKDVLEVLNDNNYLKELIKKYDFLDDTILNSNIYYPLEGYLFPATYEFYKDASIKTIIEKMLDKTKNVLDNYSTSLEESDYNIHEILTMASIIENETMVPEDRSIASQVIYKRLSINMSLGMDVTTYYGVQKALSETLTKSDLESENAYNTRRTSFLGLPVGPICNPSEASIKAALNPSDTDYIYFYADIKTGKLHFAKTYSEFQNLIQIYG
ncbi:MAG: endolytic transglycosylase MltG [Bacilli bacterium]|nr:endolytic transglycosylase MltG [Bacilli bacterium]